MAEFQEVIKQWKRRCEHCGKECVDCNINCHMCESFYYNREYIDPEFIERDVMQWAAKHPEPQYPTWIEWMKEQGLCKDEVACTGPLEHQIDMANVYVKNYILFDGERVALVTNDAYKPIPADIAKKLGIEPKEGK